MSSALSRSLVLHVERSKTTSTALLSRGSPVRIRPGRPYFGNGRKAWPCRTYVVLEAGKRVKGPPERDGEAPVLPGRSLEDEPEELSLLVRRLGWEEASCFAREFQEAD